MNTNLASPKRLIISAFSGLLLIALAGCSSGAAAPSGGYRDQGTAPQSAGAPTLAKSGNASGSATGSNNAATINLNARLIVRNATLTLIVDDTLTRADALTKLAADMGGFIAASSSTKYDAGLQSKLTLRVPSEKFDETMSAIRKQATEVRDESITGEDVTAEYTDLNSQLTNLEAAEMQLREIMSKTTQTDDVLSVYNALTQKRGEIEQVKGRIQYLARSVAMATINVTLMPDKLAQPLTVAGWRPEGVLKSAFEALISTLQAIATIAIWLVIVILPVGLILASPFIVIVLIIRGRNKQRKALRTNTANGAALPPPLAKTPGK